MQRLESLSDDTLLHDLHVIVGSHRSVTAELILHLGEVDARRLHVERGFSSLFSYCVEHLHFTEDEACRRIEAARIARRFPATYPLLQTGAVSLTVLGLLKLHLTEDNHQELLAGVSGSSVRHAKEWLAARFPQPDVPWSIRKRPESRLSAASPVSARGPTKGSTVSGRGPADGSPVSAFSARVATEASPVSGRGPTDGSPASAFSARVATDGSPVSARVATEASPVPRSPSARARIEPLSEDRFLVKFTASRVMRDKLELASDLMRHANPGGEPAVVFERALDLLIAELEKKLQGRTSRPESEPRRAKESHVTRAARREVVAHDGWRCSFVAEDGRRCDARGFLEFDHKTPKGRGGSSEANNLRVLCRSHNRWAAERVYGKAHVSQAILASRSKNKETHVTRAISASRNKNNDAHSTRPLETCPTGPSHP